MLEPIHVPRSLIFFWMSLNRFQFHLFLRIFGKRHISFWRLGSSSVFGSEAGYTDVIARAARLGRNLAIGIFPLNLLLLLIVVVVVVVVVLLLHGCNCSSRPSSSVAILQSASFPLNFPQHQPQPMSTFHSVNPPTGPTSNKQTNKQPMSTNPF